MWNKKIKKIVESINLLQLSVIMLMEDVKKLKKVVDKLEKKHATKK